MTHPSPISKVEDPEVPVDTDFDERIREMQAELEAFNAPGTLYDLPHASVKTTPKFSPEYAD